MPNRPNTPVAGIDRLRERQSSPYQPFESDGAVGPAITAGDVIAMVRSHRLRFGIEAALQRDVELMLQAAGVKYLRELELSGSDRIDFYLIDSKIGIECKVDGGPTAVASQLLRYAQHPIVAELILITSKRSHLLSVDQLSGKPVHCIWIGGSSL